MVDPFSAQFIKLTGHEPFPWQKRLFKRFQQDDLPAIVDLPTGLGKTSVMAIWYLAWSAGAPLPRRLVYVVDRRAVVDQATNEAEKIRDKASDGKLRISTLRGRYVDNREWLENPTAPAIVIGTVDMIGSRLLFSGYGVSPKMRPYHAGFLGVDSLIVLDEAHLVPPFEGLLEAIENGVTDFAPKADEGQNHVPRMRLLSLSATGRDRERRIFQIEETDLEHTIINKRLGAKKRLNFSLIEVADTDSESKKKRDLAEKLAEEAWALSGMGSEPIRCLVYCNSREVAAQVESAIEKHAKAENIHIETELFVGARRIKERTDAEKKLTQLGFLAGSDPKRERPAFLVATSAGEVGIDLDADHMACDAVSWERLVQRLGRVNRRGQGDAKIVLVHTAEPEPEESGGLTPDEQRATIAWKAKKLLGELPEDDTGIDVSPGALRSLKQRAASNQNLADKIKAATTPEPLRPALTRALVDAWSMTSLAQHTGRPEVAPWLRGWVDDEPQTTVVWRTHLPVRVEGGDVAECEIEAFFEAAPPHLSERLETETWRVFDWLKKRRKAVNVEAKPGDRITDGEPQSGNGKRAALAENDIVAFTFAPDGKFYKRYRLCDLDADNEELAGATLVVDARLKGLRDGLLDPEAESDVQTADDGSDWLLAPDKIGCRPLVGFRFWLTGTHGPLPEERHEIQSFATRRSEEGEDIECLRIATWRTEESRAASVNPQLLEYHQECAASVASRIADELGLEGSYRKALTLAARLHDEGKRAACWQRAFNAPSSGVYAKTKGPFNSAILGGYRHEFGSLSYVENDEEFQGLPEEELRDLVLHLVASHHGHARPLIQTTGCEDAPASALQDRACEVALRFARLQRRWGPWGLAWWEALLRAADQQASRENDAGEALREGRLPNG
ncbi:type I-U CRISPR-associated helicase/endonuclease Cas3 [Nitratireductor sp. XY-223]|uniref:type I-G CRISPR-associated helicase/endonuclease Cas3g n=1 Tax=Nitratireductor sp. XY-223 TaxID=2561926 RepID=UPI0019817B04|nr:type I-U CRISPR-associated helicase/endonuclease Cas3 [Nitratireductor sp. XY-223]